MRRPGALVVATLCLGAPPAFAQTANDFDGDRVLDAADNCRFTANPDQADASVPSDGEGDACTCGDLQDDGRVDLLDAVILARALQSLAPGIADPAKCSVTGGSTDCIATELFALRAALASPQAELPPVCLAAVGASDLPVAVSVAGDSITRAFAADCECNLTPSCLLACAPNLEQPEHSWFDGDDSSVFSVHDRYRFFDPTVRANHSAAALGARMRGGDDSFAIQAGRIVAQNPLPDLVIVLLGGNDLCSRECVSPAHCSSPLFTDAEWRAALQLGLDTLMAGLAQHATVYLGSVPRVQDLRAAGIAKQNADSEVDCELAWETFDLCQIATDPTVLNGETLAVRLAGIGERQRRYNEILAEQADAYASNANGRNPLGIGVVAEYVDPLTPSLGNAALGPQQINGGDCFHPSRAGQNQIAELLWRSDPKR